MHFLISDNFTVSIYSLDEHVRLLSKEVQVDFSRSMNRITFDRIISNKPETYPFVTLPQEEEEVIPERGTCTWNNAPYHTSSCYLSSRYMYTYTCSVHNFTSCIKLSLLYSTSKLPVTLIVWRFTYKKLSHG